MHGRSFVVPKQVRKKNFSDKANADNSYLYLYDRPNMGLHEKVSTLWQNGVYDIRKREYHIVSNISETEVKWFGKPRAKIRAKNMLYLVKMGALVSWKDVNRQICDLGLHKRKRNRLIKRMLNMNFKGSIKNLKM